MANVDLEFLGPLDATEFRSEGQAALPDIIILAFSTVALPTSLDAGAHVFSLAVVEVAAEILTVCAGRSDGMALPPSRFSCFAIGGAVCGGTGGVVLAWRSPRG